MRATLSSAVRALLSLRALAFTLAAGAALAGCDDGSSDPPDAGPDAPVQLKCYENPKTHNELINACTTGEVVRIDKRPVLPLLGSDGTLPPLP